MISRRAAVFGIPSLIPAALAASIAAGQPAGCHDAEAGAAARPAQPANRRELERVVRRFARRR